MQITTVVTMTITTLAIMIMIVINSTSLHKPWLQKTSAASQGGPKLCVGNRNSTPVWLVPRRLNQWDSPSPCASHPISSLSVEGKNAGSRTPGTSRLCPNTPGPRWRRGCKRPPEGATSQFCKSSRWRRRSLVGGRSKTPWCWGHSRHKCSWVVRGSYRIIFSPIESLAAWLLSSIEPRASLRQRWPGDAWPRHLTDRGRRLDT